jgi:arylsulfatase A-like enzyme
MPHHLSRRTFLQTALLGATAPALATTCSAQADTPPNIIFIIADDLGYADLRCYGQKLIQTPNIDRLAAEGTRFTQCYAGASVCAPSRCVLMTGRHTGHATVRGNSGENAPKHDGQKGRIPLFESDVTVAQVLKNAGYATAITGKWGLGEPGSTGLPNDHGFDEWFGYLNNDHAPDYFTDHLWRNKALQTIEANKDGKRGAYSCDLFTDFSLDFIRAKRAKPFYLYFAPTIPHANLEVPDLAPYADKPWPQDAKTFAAMITRMDTHVGKVLALLKELDLEKNTIVFFTSDNGAPNRWEGMFDSCGPLRAKKSSVYEGGLRVPMIARWPEKIPAGAVSDAPWYFADVLPTMAALAHTQAPADIDGIDISANFFNAKQRSPLPPGTATTQEKARGGSPLIASPDRFLYWEQRRDNPQRLEQAVRWGNWKGVRTGLGEPLELYDLATDTGETNNLADKHADVVSEIERYLKTARTPSPYWPLSGER